MIIKFLKKNDNFKLNIFIFFSLIALILRIWVSQYGSNFDFASWQANLDIFKDGKSVYENGNYVYAPPWVYTLYFLDLISFPFLENNSFVQSIPGNFFRFKLVIFLSLLDISIFYLLYKKYSLKVGLLFLINPISIWLSGFHNSFDNYAIIFGFLSVILYGEINEEKLTFKKVFAIFLFGLSIAIKHILIFFIFWWAFKEKKIINKFIVIFIPIFVFIFSFIPFLPEDSANIINKLLFHAKHETGPFWKMFVPDLFKKFLSTHFLFSFLLTLIGVFLINKKINESFYLYLIAVVAFSSQMYTQYFLIPLITIAIYWNKKYFFYTLIASFIFLIDADQFNHQYLSDIFNWSLRSTRISYYPLILILLYSFVEMSVGTKKIRKKLNYFKKIIIKKTKKSLSLN